MKMVEPGLVKLQLQAADLHPVFILGEVQSDKTVGTERKQLVGTAEIPQLEVTEGLDGKKRKKPIRTTYIDDTPEGKSV